MYVKTIYLKHMKKKIRTWITEKEKCQVHLMEKILDKETVIFLEDRETLRGREDNIE